MLEQIHTSAKTVTILGIPYQLCFIKSWEALLFFNSNTLDKVFLDGSQINIGSAFPSWYLGNRVGGQPCWFPYGIGTIPIYGADEITGQHQPSNILNPDWPIPYSPYLAGDYIDDLAGLFLHKSAPGQIDVHRLSDGTLLGQILIPGNPWFSNLAYVQSGQVFGSYGTSGAVALLDYFSREVIWQSQVRPFKAAAYDCVHNLVVTLETDGKVRLYLTTPIPSSLTAPAFDPPGNPYRMRANQVSTRLLGDLDEPCPNRWVHWELLGDPALGSLWKDKSRTDADGYAENFYIGPLVGAGEETVKVRCFI